MPHVNIKGVGTAQFPDNMPINDIRAFLQKKFAQDVISGRSDVLAPAQDIAAPHTPTLTERFGQGISDTLIDTGIISSRHGAQQIGKNIAAIGEFLPGIGDAAAGDEFGRAVAQGDTAGIALGALSAIPVVGRAIKKGLQKTKSIDLPSGKLGSDQFKLIKQIDPKAKTKVNADGTISVTYLEGQQLQQSRPTGDVNKLPMDETGRMARAKEQGFDIDTTLFHGTGANITEFKKEKIGSKHDTGFHGEGFYFSQDPDYASSYAPKFSGAANVMPVKVRSENPFIRPSRATHGAEWRSAADVEYKKVGINNDTSPKERTRLLKEAGYDSVIIPGLDDEGNKIIFEQVIFEPENIRSKFAKFDPKNKGSANLLGGLGALGVSSALINTPEDATN